MSAPRLLSALGLLTVSAAIIASARGRVEHAPPNWRAAFTAAALKIPFDSERTPVPFDGVPAGARVPNAPRMTIASARTRDTGRVGTVGARITSEAAYPALGIAPGVNYLWRDVVNGVVREFVIPADTAYRERWLSVEGHKHAPAKQAPRLVVVRVADAIARQGNPDSAPTVMFAMAVCDRGCEGTGTWCIAQDTTKSKIASALRPPLDDIAKFFARNKVPWPKG
jgi:hypothetical protein